MSGSAKSPGALSGLKVIDLTRMLAGPYCTMMLADLGADVLKIEPLGGDPIRDFGPYAPDDRLRVLGGYFQSINRGKKGVALDFRLPEGREILMRLVKDADVLVENFRVGVMDRLGLSYESLRRVNPRLVYGCVRGFGDPRTGASQHMNRPAYDLVVQAMGGLMSITGPAPDLPMKTGPGIGDTVPAMMLAVGILAAAWHAQRTGEGQMVDVAMYDGVLALCERIVYQYSLQGKIPVPEGNVTSFLCPYEVLPTSDGWVVIAAPTDNHWVELCRKIELPQLGADPHFATNDERVKRAPEIRTMLAEWTSVRSRREVVGILGGSVPCGPVNTARDILEDPHMEQRDMIVKIEQPGLDRPLAVVGAPIKMTETPSGVRNRAPILGENTESVLIGLGYSQERIEKLASAGVIGLYRGEAHAATRR